MVVVDKQRTWRIVYNALTRQWRIGTGDLSLPESSLSDALSLIRHIRGWAVADLSDLEPDRQYQGRIRVRLNTSLLARPFQVDAFNSSAWSLATPRSEEHTSELQTLMRISYAVFCLKKKKNTNILHIRQRHTK